MLLKPLLFYKSRTHIAFGVLIVLISQCFSFFNSRFKNYSATSRNFLVGGCWLGGDGYCASMEWGAGSGERGAGISYFNI
jgi:hypothetical protein